mmetsp:Transcript_52350/g.126623  ORF Transcript_52350/g.126623 Transcript_52350/m.126623 type:complete len:200 (-) Transcript_52350:79-678(-)
MVSKRSSFLLPTSRLSTMVFTTTALLVVAVLTLFHSRGCDHVVAVEAFSTAPKIMRTSHSTTTQRRISSSVLSMAADGDGDDDEETQAQIDSTPTQMQKDFPVRTEEPDPDKVWKTLGLDRAAIIMPIVLLINIWFFTIPPEFRRARMCSEMDTAAYPEQCMTPKMFASGIVDYYKGGGGIQWDFSIAEDNPFVAPKSE